jgi:hypothetical protein
MKLLLVFMPAGNAASPVTGGGEETSSSTTVDRQAAMTRRTPSQLLPRTGKFHSTGYNISGYSLTTEKSQYYSFFRRILTEN